MGRALNGGCDGTGDIDGYDSIHDGAVDRDARLHDFLRDPPVEIRQYPRSVFDPRDSVSHDARDWNGYRHLNCVSDDGGDGDGLHELRGGGAVSYTSRL